RWLRLVTGFCFFGICLVCALNYNTSVYLLRQARGQLSVLTGSVAIDEFTRANALTPSEKENLRLIARVKKYSTDSLGYVPTANFTTVYDQGLSPVLWFITACGPYDFAPYQWRFPLVGDVSYKGFFDKEIAWKEYRHLRALGYDAD